MPLVIDAGVPDFAALPQGTLDRLLDLLDFALLELAKVEALRLAAEHLITSNF